MILLSQRPENCCQHKWLQIHLVLLYNYSKAAYYRLKLKTKCSEQFYLALWFPLQTRVAVILTLVSASTNNWPIDWLFVGPSKLRFCTTKGGKLHNIITHNIIFNQITKCFLYHWQRALAFLAHLSTKCSWWAIVVSGLSVVRRRPSSVVRRASTFDVYTLETTFVIRFLWNLVRMFVLTISRPSLNMGHVMSKTRSPGQILGNSCLHSRGHICNPMLMKLCQNVCFGNI